MNPHTSQAMKHLISLLTVTALACGAVVSAQEAKQAVPTPAAADVKPAPVASLDLLRDKEVIGLFSSLPVQEDGRVKPLDTLARFKLLRFSGKQSGISATRMNESTGKTEPIDDPATGKPLVDAKGKKITFTAMEWLLVSWFRPDIAKQLPVFVVDNSEAVTELELKAKGKRDRYTYNEIEPGRTALMRKMQEVRNVDAKQRTPVQRALAKLAFDFLDYEMILSHFDFARAPFGKELGSLPPELAALVKDGQADWAALLPKMLDYFKSHPEAAAPMANPWLREYYRTLVGALMSGNEESLPRFFPPPVEKIEVWHNPGTILKSVLDGTTATAEDIGHLVRYGKLATTATDPAAFKATLKELHESVTKLAAARNQPGHVALELHYHRFDYFYNALLCFTFGLLLLALSWVNPATRWGRLCRTLCMLLTLCGTVLGAVGIIARCLIMERPPITSLYETIIFISTTAALLALIAEWITKKGWALAVASVAGTCGMFLSIRFMNMEGRDTMEQLQAVLITNFWLSTHVPCINLGYTAGMVSAIFSVMYVMGRLTPNLAKHDLKKVSWIGTSSAAGLFLAMMRFDLLSKTTSRDFSISYQTKIAMIICGPGLAYAGLVYLSRLVPSLKKGIPVGSAPARDLTRMAYAFVMAGLFLSLVGTVLGGIWANYSWGRFWGWDPKENGALMIVLVNLAILHARLGGYIKEAGFHCCGIFLGMVVAFSWFATNQLGVGLHSYGAMEGAWMWLYIFWGMMTLLLIVGAVIAMSDRRAKRPADPGNPALADAGAAA